MHKFFNLTNQKTAFKKIKIHMKISFIFCKFMQFKQLKEQKSSLFKRLFLLVTDLNRIWAFVNGIFL